MTLQNIRYLFPSGAYLLILLIPLLLVFWWLFESRKRTLEKFASSSVLAQILIPRPTFAFWTQAAAYCLGWIFATIAFMQPVSYGHYADSTLKQAPPISHDVVFLIDASASMNVSDGYEGHTRLEHAKTLLDEIIPRLEGEQAALYAFTSESVQIAPFTRDYLFIRLVLRQIQINEGGSAGTHLLDTLKTVYDTVLKPSSARLKTLVLFSDGEDTLLEADPSQAHQKQEQLTEWLTHAKEDHLRLFTVGMGTTTGKAVPGILFHEKPVISSLNTALLEELSARGEGSYTQANSYAAIDLADRLVKQMEQDYPQLQAEETQSLQQELIYDHYFQYPLALAILLFILAMGPLQYLKTLQKGLLLVGFLLGNGALQAISEQTISQLRLANVRLESGDASHAIPLYEQALQENLDPWERALIMYNLGSARLEEKRWEESQQTFQAISAEGPLAAVVNYRRHYNEALIPYRKALAELVETPDKAIATIEKGAPLLQSARTAFCSLQEAEGIANCPASEELSFLEHAFLSAKEHAFSSQDEQLIQSPKSENEGVSLLIHRIEQIQRQLSALQKIKEQDEAKKLYRQFIHSDDTRWTTLSSQVQKKLSGAQKKSNQELLSEASAQFTEGMTRLEKNDLPTADSSLEKARLLLEQLLKNLPPPSPPSPAQQEQGKEKQQTPRIDKVLQLLMQMDQQDRLPAQEPSLRNQEERPW